MNHNQQNNVSQSLATNLQQEVEMAQFPPGEVVPGEQLMRDLMEVEPIINQMRNAPGGEWTGYLEWLKALNPCKLWKRAVAHVYVRYLEARETWSFVTFMRKLKRVYASLQCPSDDRLVNGMLQHSSVLAIYLSNPTHATTGMYLIYLCCSLNISVARALTSLADLIKFALVEGFSFLKQLLEKVKNALTSTITGEGPTHPTSLEDVSLKGLATTLMAMVSALIHSITESAGKMIAKTLNECTQSINGLSKTYKSTEHMCAKLNSLVTVMIGCVYPNQNMMKLLKSLADNDLKFGEAPISVEEFMEKMDFYGSLEGAKLLKDDVNLLRDVVTLKNDARLIFFTLQNDENKKMFGSFLSRLELSTHVAAQQMSVPLRKHEPFFFTMFGVPGIGKSVAMDLLWAILKKDMEDIPYLEFPINNRLHEFAWTDGTNFASGYLGQYMIMMDDANKEAKYTDNCTANHLVNMVSPSGFNIPGAAIDQKINPFSTKLILATTNNPFPTGNALNMTVVEAYYRRRNLLIKMVPSTVMDTDLGRAAKFQVFDPKKPGGTALKELTFKELYVMFKTTFEKHWIHEKQMSNVHERAGVVLANMRRCQNHVDQPVAIHPCDSIHGPLDETIFRDVDLSSEDGDLIDAGLMPVPEGLTHATARWGSDSEDEEQDFSWQDETPPTTSSDSDSSEEDYVWTDCAPMRKEMKESTYMLTKNGESHVFSLMDSHNPRAMFAACAMITRPQSRQLSNGWTIHLVPISIATANMFHGMYGLDLDQASYFMDFHNFEIRQGLREFETQVTSGGSGNQRLYVWGSRSDYGDPIIHHPGLWDEGETVPTALIDGGTQLRLKFTTWLNWIKKWKVSVGISVVLGASLLAYKLYKATNVEPTYSATSIGQVHNKKHDFFPASAKSRGKNVVVIEIGGASAIGFCYKGKSVLTVKHAGVLAKPTDLITIHYPDHSKITERFEPSRWVPIGAGSDLAVYTFIDPTMLLAKDAISKFATRLDKKVFDTVLIGAYAGCQKFTAKTCDGYSYHDAVGNAFSNHGGLEIGKKLDKGGSGSILIDVSTNKIIGIQVASNNVRSFFEFLPVELLPTQNPEGETSATAASGLKFVKKAEIPIISQGRTKIIPSIISTFMVGMFSTIMIPAALWGRDKRIKPEEQTDNLLLKSMMGYDHPFASLDKNIGDRVVRELSMEDSHVRKSETKPRLLTDQEMLNGNESFHLKPFVINTSAGLPWKHEEDKGQGKRKHIIGDVPDRVMSEQLQQVIETYDFDATLEGYACNKDELRSPTKVEMGKTRSFIVLPMQYNLLLRKYFGMFTGVQHQMAGSISSCVGINPYKDWERIYRRLARCSMEWEDFDYADWDRTLSPDWFMLYAERVSNWYNDGDENRVIRRKLMTQLAFSNVQIGADVYSTAGGNKSGCAITAEVNTDIHEMLMLYCWFKLAREHDKLKSSLYEFRQCNELLLYGDDQVKATRDAPWFNGNNLEPLMIELGMKITPADKKGTDFTVKNPEEVTFLKRNFGARVDVDLMYCPLAPDSIFKMFHYIKKGNEEHAATKINIDTALKEMFHHGEVKYNVLMAQVMRATKESGLTATPELKSWQDYQRDWLLGDLEQPNFWGN